MTRPISTVVGLDIGTTTSKAVIRKVGRHDSLIVEQRTPWRTQTDLQTDVDPAVLLELALALLTRSARAAESAWGRVQVRSIAVTGLAESGVLLDPAGRPIGPAIAWFDRRGEADVDRIRRDHPDFVELFPAITGLPWSHQASIAKLLCLGTISRIARGSTWLSVPEWIVHGLGGGLCREPSLASRTGLIDQNTGQPWDAALTVAGLPAAILPEERPAGHPSGRLTHDDAPDCAASAVLSVAGHDHPVAALGAGAVGPDELFNSSGTADVIARSVPGVLDDAQRRRVVAVGWSAGQHIVPGTTLLLAGGSGGLLLRRVLSALGADAPDARDALDIASLNVGKLPPGLSITGDGRTQHDVVIRIQDDAGPAAVWAAATRYTAELTRSLLADIEPIVGPHRRATAAGGWTRMQSVRATKTAAIGQLRFSEGAQPGAVGAALLADYALNGQATALYEFLRQVPRPPDA